MSEQDAEADRAGAASPIDELHLFVDEAGDPNLFDASGTVIVETNGCSRFFIMGKLEVENPDLLAARLTDLRTELLADPYFAGVPSFQLGRKKTAVQFHAKDDVPEVRYLVFELVRSMGRDLRFHAVVCDKHQLARGEAAKREKDTTYRYRPDDLYDGLVRTLFRKFHGHADAYNLSVAKRGLKTRNQALTAALQHAERDFESRFGFRRGGNWTIAIADPRTTVCLQAVDYFLWAVQRFYEQRRDGRSEDVRPREDRYLNLLWPQIAEIHDLDYGPDIGTYFGPQRPLTIEVRFPDKPPKKRKP